MTNQSNGLTNGENQKSHHKRNHEVLHDTTCGRHEKSSSYGNGASSSHNETSSEEDALTFTTDTEGTPDNETPHAKVEAKQERQRELSFQDMYNDEVFFDDDEEDDSDWEPVHDTISGRHKKSISNGNGASSSHNKTSSEEDALTFTTDTKGTPDNEAPHAKIVAKKERQRELTFQDMYNDEVFFDDDEEDDSDWEPVQKHVEMMKWFCTNCTMVNLGVIKHCYICGEHKDSGILRQGFFASPLSEDSGPTEDEPEVKRKNKDICARNETSNCHTAIGFDERMLLHSEVEMKSHPHPERPNRLRAIAASLATAGIFPGRCYPITAREITREELQTVHTLEHVQTVELTGHIFSSYFTPDTYANEHSARAARLAAGLCADLASAIFSGRAKNGFALVRPPGHHAGVSQAMGFCLHNNAAVAALAAQVAGAKKVLIVDWDVHHGNGTQEIFDGNKSVLYVSLHRHEGGKFYPGTGAADEVGSNGAEGYCVNVPWSCGGVGDNDYIFAFQHVVLPIATEFAPDFTIISAGFDAARGDPLGCCDVTPSGYAHMTDMLYKLSGGKLLVILEGGYNLRSISSSATAVIEVLLGEVPEWEEEEVVPSKAGLKAVLDVLKVQLNYWPSLRSSYEQLESRFAQLQSQWREDNSENKKAAILKRRRSAAPTFWKYGRKKLFYHFLSGHLRANQRAAN